MHHKERLQKDIDSRPLTTAFLSSARNLSARLDFRYSVCFLVLDMLVCDVLVKLCCNLGQAQNCARLMPGPWPRLTIAASRESSRSFHLPKARNFVLGHWQIQHVAGEVTPAAALNDLFPELRGNHCVCGFTMSPHSCRPCFTIDASAIGSEISQADVSIILVPFCALAASLLQASTTVETTVEN